MTRLEVEAFLAIVKYGSISQAADRLFVTQPALSRRIRAAEEELGYELFERGRGIRNVRLTEAGRDFTAVAERFLQLYKEAEELPVKRNKRVLKVSTINSLSYYLIPGVVRRLMEETGCTVAFQSGRSMDAYGYIESGAADIALISDAFHSTKVITAPILREPFVFAGGEKWRGIKQISPRELDPEKQIRMPWNPEYSVWHNRWFAAGKLPALTTDKMELLEEFLEGERWAVVPLMVARRIRRRDIWICPMTDGPEDLTIYFITAGKRKDGLDRRFLQLVQEELADMEGIQWLMREEK